MRQVGPFPTTIQGKGQGNVITNSNCEKFLKHSVKNSCRRQARQNSGTKKKEKRKKR